MMEILRSYQKHGSSQINARCAVAGVILILLYRPVCAAEISITIEDRKQRPVHDTVIELLGADNSTLAAKEIEITQQAEEFNPLLSLIPQGSSVLFSNRDPFKHHVYSVSTGNEFDLPLFSDEPVNPVPFDTPGVVKLGCNIHDWMLAFGYISESGNVTVTDQGGSAQFTGLSPGNYELRVWNPRFKNNRKIIVQSLSLQENQSLEHTVEVSLRKKIRKPSRKANSKAISADNYQGNH